MKQRLLQFDIAKALCIILVAIGHYVPEGMPEWYKLIHDWIYFFHMPLFFFASGYIYIAYKKGEYGEFILKKIKRLMIPYFTVSVIVITIKLLTQRGMYVEHPVTILSYFKIFYLPEAGYFLWFVWALFLMFCIVPLFHEKWSRLGLFIMSLFLHYYHPFTLTRIFCIEQAVNMLLWFMFGVMCYDWKSMIEKIMEQKMTSNIIKGLILVLFCIVSAMMCVCGNDILVSRAMKLLPWLGIGSVMVVSTWMASLSKRYFMKPLLMVSSSSYIVYLFHTTFMGFAKSFVHKIPVMNGGDEIMFVLGAIIVILCGVICPIILHKYVLNRWKGTRILLGLK